MTDLILNALLPIAFAITLGWLSGRLGYLKHAHADVFAVFVLRFALPISLFLGAVKTPASDLTNLPFALCLTLGLMGTFLCALFTGLFIFRHDLRTSTMQALVCAFPDMAYFGAPVLSIVIGPTGFLAVLIGNLITSLFMLPLTIILTQAGGKEHGGSPMPRILADSIVKAVLNPIVWLPVLGAVLSFAHVKLPTPLTDSFDLIAKSAGGASLFALGLMFYGERVHINADVITNIGFKNFLQPALMMLGVLLFGVTGSLAHQAILTGAIPTATAASMFALRNKTYTKEAASSIFISTLLGILTESALIAWLSSGN